MFAYGASAADGADCATVPEAERSVCELEVRCEALADEARRRDCLVAADALRKALGEAPAEDAQPVHPIEDAQPVPVQPDPVAPVPEAEPERRGVLGRLGRGVSDFIRRDRPEPAPPPEPTPQPTTLPEPRAPAPAIEEQVVSTAITRTTVDREVLTIPEHFVGDVTAHRELVRDRQLIAVNGEVLFEGDVARNSKIREGDHVEVQKVSSLFGERYRIIGPSKRAVMALRIRCERVELNTDDRRKCVLLPDD